MCGRYAFIPQGDFYDRFEIDDREIKAGTSYNIAPGAMVPVVTINSPRKLQLMRWGLIPSWAKDPRIAYHTINARSEEIENKPAFRAAFKYRRCLVPASGFFEWKKAKDEGKSVKFPYWIKLKDADMFGFAGVYEEGTFSIVTTAANEIMKPIHDRMPVILHREQEDRWLENSKFDLKELKSLMVPYPSEEMTAVRVSPRVNNPMNNSPDLLTEI